MADGSFWFLVNRAADHSEVRRNSSYSSRFRTKVSIFKGKLFMKATAVSAELRAAAPDHHTATAVFGCWVMFWVPTGHSCQFVSSVSEDFTRIPANVSCGLGSAVVLVMNSARPF